jgi:potassium-transporting ATPase KdpC subunit
MRVFIRQLRPALLIAVLFTVLLGGVYPLVTTGIGQLAFNDTANGSLVERDGVVVGSRLIGQAFAARRYFHSRPSAAGDGYDGAASSGSNLGPTSQDLLDAVAERAAAYREENDLPSSELVPVDAVTASASGLDPAISIANARLQAPRVAAERGLGIDAVLELVDDHTDDRDLFVLGEPAVNVLELNLALDDLS